jgi:hypothetical protein
MIIDGIVFNDKNNNGVKDLNEEGVRGVVLSDGINIVTTNSKGYYRITKNPKSRFVFVITPSGYSNTTPFYEKVPARKEAVSFGLKIDPNTDNANFRFVQISDAHIGTHIGMSSITSMGFLEDIAEVNSLKPAFIVSTGDFINFGNYMFFYEDYKDVVLKSKVFVYSVIGDHEYKTPLVDYKWSLKKKYEDMIGPRWYAFNYGKRHFVVLDCFLNRGEQFKWLEKELSLLSKGTEIIIFQHHSATKHHLDLQSKFNNKPKFNGPLHSKKVWY